MTASLLSLTIDGAAKRVIENLSAQPSSLSGDDSGLGNVWLEYAAQVQGEESGDFGMFEAHVRETVEGVLFGVDSATLRTLWLKTSAGRDWLDERGATNAMPPIEVEDVVEAVFGAVRAKAADWSDDRIDRFLSTGDDDLDLYLEEPDDQ